VTISLSERGVRGVLLDIEGTTTPLSFVHDVLFPYARTQLRAHLRKIEKTSDGQRIERLLREEHAADVARGDAPPPLDEAPRPVARESLAVYVEWLMDRDRKSTGLKQLQGESWRLGYGEGKLRGAVFPDVPSALERWRGARLDVAIYSSGSVLAQKLLFSSTPYGDLVRFIGHFFDTLVGQKRETGSYEAIARAMDLPRASILFLSDVPEELHAAHAAGMLAVLSVRPGNAVTEAAGFPSVRSFDEIQP